jgi:hypothetical protein
MDGSTVQKAETANSSRRKEAERLREVNRGVRLPIDMSFKAFANEQWGTYVKQNLKPSTQSSHNSPLKTHFLPAFGDQRLSQINGLQIMDLYKFKGTTLKSNLC